MDSQYTFQGAQQAYVAHICCSCVMTGQWCGDVNRGSDPAFPICVWAMGEFMRGQAVGLAASYGLEPVAAPPAARVEIDLTQDEPAETVGATAAQEPEYIDLTQDEEEEEDNVEVTGSQELVKSSTSPEEVNAPLTPGPVISEPPRRKYGRGKREWLLRRSTIEVTRVVNGSKVHYAANGSVASQSELAAMYEAQLKWDPQTEALEQTFEAMTQPASTQLAPTTLGPIQPAPALAEPTLPSPQGPTDGKKRKASLAFIDSDAGPSKRRQRSPTPHDRQANDDQKDAELFAELAKCEEQGQSEAEKSEEQMETEHMEDLVITEEEQQQSQAKESDHDDYDEIMEELVMCDQEREEQAEEEDESLNNHDDGYSNSEISEEE